MAWTAPKTWTASTMLTAAELNEQLRDNMLETLPAKATTAGGFFVTDYEGQIVERVIKTARVLTKESRPASGSTYADIATIGPKVEIETGSKALVLFSTRIDNNSADALSAASFAVSGATTIAASDEWCIKYDGIAGAPNEWQLGMYHMLTNLTPGLNTFTMKYRTGGAGTGLFWRRFITVWPL